MKTATPAARILLFGLPAMLLIASLAFGGCTRSNYVLRGRVLTSYDVLEPGHQFYGDPGTTRPEGVLEPLERVHVRFSIEPGDHTGRTWSNQYGVFETNVPAPLFSGQPEYVNFRIVLNKPGFEAYQIDIPGMKFQEARRKAEAANVTVFLEVWLPPDFEL